MSDQDERSLKQAQPPLPPHLEQWGGMWVRAGEAIVEAPPEDVAAARSYPSWPDKGELVAGSRLTIISAKRKYRIGEEVRIIHVKETVEAGHSMRVMGPKTIFGEFVDGNLATEECDQGEDYDGAVINTPAVDYNYDVTSYRFSSPGKHNIYWQMHSLRSNTLELEVAET